MDREEITMIPNGHNPHGLEERLLTFCVLENNNPSYVTYAHNRLYCWATFPQDIVEQLRSNYGVQMEDIELSVEKAENEVSWNELQKYKSKEIPGTHFMIQDNWDDVNKKYTNGDQTFYYHVWSNGQVPSFATIYILDISESMDSRKDKLQVKYGITGEIYDYNTSIWSTKDSKIYVYSANKLSNMKVEESVLGQIKFGDATSKEIWDTVDPFIENAMKKTGLSESMVTNMYYSIANFMKIVFEGDGAETIGANCRLSSAAFIMFTDESIFTSDTLSSVGKLTKEGDAYYHEWFKNWQKNATNKFPDKLPGLNVNTKREFCMSITKALRQMSYYYGVNFNWGLYGGLCTPADRESVVDQKTATFLNKCEVTLSGDYPITYDGGVAWTIPDTFPIVNPHDPMCIVVLSIPQDYIDASIGGQALKNERIMETTDQYIQENVLYKFHKESDTEYFAFRYIPTNWKNFSESPIILPSIEEMNIVVEKPIPEPETGQVETQPITQPEPEYYRYHWETYNLSSENIATLVDCGGSYLVNADDYENGTQLSKKPTIRFRLVRET